MPDYSLVPIHLGRLHLDLGIMTYRMNYGVKKWLPIISWFIKGPDLNILVDSGISAAESAWYTETPIEDLCTFEQGLEKVGLRPDQIDLVIQTHLHFDHAGNTHRCTRAKTVVQRSELKFALAPHPMQGYLYNPEILRDLRFELVDGDTEILPGIEVIHLPSHTPGTQAVSVQTSRGKAVISGMCCIKDNFNPSPPKTGPQNRHFWRVIPPGNFMDLDQAYFNTLRLKNLADILIPQHDPSLFDVTEIPG
ncbi:MAG: N-acyl homoserine lactonase family protein [Deltaproteobacteria bacterium]|nr:N-acyl homoserine lactonase family protein [Deltaproteobacteria bacterium]